MPPAAWITLGALVIALGLWDVFLTVLHYENPGIVAVHAYRLLWEAIRWTTAPLPRAVQALARSLAGPLMVLVTVAGWLGLQILGFALVDYPAVASPHFEHGAAGHSFGTALYFSSASLTSLSFTDVEPKSLAYHAVAAAETIVGLGILTLAISYILNLYRVLQDQGVLASMLSHHSRGSSEPVSLLEPHFVDGRPVGLGTLLRELHRNLTEHHEGMRRYPVVWYFHTRRPYRSLPYIFWVIGAAAAAVRWGLPDDHPAVSDAWLPALIDGFEDVLEQMAHRFLPTAPPERADPLPFDAFRATLAAGGPEDELLEVFLATEEAVCALAQVSPEEDVARRYERFCEWHRFASRGRAFVRLASRDLGIDLSELYGNPSQRLY